MSRKIVISFMGMKDPYRAEGDQAGPILSLLRSRSFHQAFLICNSPAFLERAKDLERECADDDNPINITAIDLPIHDIISYEEIWQKLSDTLEKINVSIPASGNEWYFLLDSGTPQMKACLFFAGRSGRYPVRLLQGIPPEHAQGAYKVRDITDRIPSLPTRDFYRNQESFSRTLYQGMVSETIHENQAVPSSERIIHRNKAMQEALQRARRAGKYREPVLILGQTGTGKTLIARAIHDASDRSDMPFVELNCSAIPVGLAESLLFGHERGAFTGADRARSGALRSADKGTILLDEVGDLSIDVQVKLLKAIEEQKFLPVGADHPVRVDVRIIAATNQDLRSRVRAGTFRQDLHERLKVIVITLPPLKDRPEDIEALAEQTLQTWNHEYGERKYLSDQAAELLAHYQWPGNVRELINSIRSAAATATSDEILPDHFPDDLRLPESPESITPITQLPHEGLDLRARILQVEWEYVERALRRSSGNREEAARMLGMTGHALRKALRERFISFMQQGDWEEE